MAEFKNHNSDSESNTDISSIYSISINSDTENTVAINTPTFVNDTLPTRSLLIKFILWLLVIFFGCGILITISIILIEYNILIPVNFLILSILFGFILIIVFLYIYCHNRIDNNITN
jgi:hypothetical protein